MGKLRVVVVTLATVGVVVVGLSGAPEAKPKPVPPPPQVDGTWEVNLTATLSTCPDVTVGSVRLTTWKIEATRGGWRITTDGAKPRGYSHTWKGTDRSGAVALDAGRASAGEIRAQGGSIAGSLVEVSGGRAPCAVVYRVYGIPPAPATQPLAINAGLPPTGVPECDDYLGRMMTCIDQMPNMDANSRAQMKKALSQAAEQMAKANPGGNAPQVQQSMARACTQAVDASRKAYQQLGCTF